MFFFNHSQRSFVLWFAWLQNKHGNSPTPKPVAVLSRNGSLTSPKRSRQQKDTSCSKLFGHVTAAFCGETCWGCYPILWYFVGLPNKLQFFMWQMTNHTAIPHSRLTKSLGPQSPLSIVDVSIPISNYNCRVYAIICAYRCWLLGIVPFLMFSSWFLPSLTVDMEVPMCPSKFFEFWIWIKHDRAIQDQYGAGKKVCLE